MELFILTLKILGGCAFMILVGFAWAALTMRHAETYDLEEED